MKLLTADPRVELVLRLLDNGIEACLDHRCEEGCPFCKMRDALEAETNDTVKSDVGGLSRGVQGTAE